jgi:hypothetical protein
MELSTVKSTVCKIILSYFCYGRADARYMQISSQEKFLIEDLFRVIALLRDAEITNIPFYISSSGHLCHSFNRKILSIAFTTLPILLNQE